MNNTKKFLLVKQAIAIRTGYLQFFTKFFFQRTRQTRSPPRTGLIVELEQVDVAVGCPTRQGILRNRIASAFVRNAQRNTQRGGCMKSEMNVSLKECSANPATHKTLSYYVSQRHVPPARTGRPARTLELRRAPQAAVHAAARPGIRGTTARL